MSPLTRERASLFWRRVTAEATAGDRVLLVAQDEHGICGTVQLVLHTASDDARRLYERLGWIKVGDITAYALLPDGTPCATTYYFRELSPA